MESQSTAPRIKVFGTWAEQTSSSGKRYYYNSATNVSQWDKPAEWKQAEKLRASSTAAVVKNERGGGSASVTPTDKVSPTSSSTVPIAKCLPNAFVTNSASRQFRQSNLAASTFSSSSTPMSTKADSSAAIVMNSASPLPSAAKRQRLMADEDGCAMSANLGTAAPIHGGKKPNILLNQQQQVSSTTADSAAMDGGESNHRTDRNVTPTTTAFSSSSPTTIGKPANRPHMQAIQSTSNSAANRDQQQRLSSSPVKLASSYGNAAATEQTISSTGTPPSSMNCGATTPFPTKLRSLMSIGTSSPPVISSSTMMMMASSGAGRQQQQQQTCSTSNGTMTTTADGGRTQHQEKEMTETRTEIFREEKYQKYWRPELTAQSRRALGTDAFANEMRKCVDRANKQTASNFGLERDIHSICTLEQIAFLRTELCKQRLNAVQQRIQELGERTT